VSAGGGQVVAGDRLRLRAPVLVARELVDHVRPLPSEIEHEPAAVGGLSHDQLVPVSDRVVIARNRWVFHRGSSLRGFSPIAARA